jgi:hypothetical protein
LKRQVPGVWSGNVQRFCTDEKRTTEHDISTVFNQSVKSVTNNSFNDKAVVYQILNTFQIIRNRFFTFNIFPSQNLFAAAVFEHNYAKISAPASRVH